MKSFQKCPQCDAIVSAKNFTSHLINKHSDSKRPLSFVCPYPPCTRAFAYSKLLLDHIRKKHSGIGSNSDGPSTETPDPPPSGELSIDIPNPSSDDNPTTEDDVIDLNLDQDISDQNLGDDEEDVSDLNLEEDSFHQNVHTTGPPAQQDGDEEDITDLNLDEDAQPDINDLTYGGMVSTRVRNLIKGHSVVKGAMNDYKFTFTETGKESLLREDSEPHLFRDILRHFVQHTVQSVPDPDTCKLCVTISANTLEWPCRSNMWMYPEANVDNLLNQMEGVISSSSTCSFNDDFMFRVELLRTGPATEGLGARYGAKNFSTCAAFMACRRSVWSPPPMDFANSCFTAVIAYALLRSQVPPTRCIRQLSFHRTPNKSMELRDKMLELSRGANIDLNKKAGSQEWSQMSEYLGYSAHIQIYADECKPQQIYSSPHSFGIKILVFADKLSDEWHCYWIRSLHLLGTARYECDTCGKTYNKVNNHVCSHLCRMCRDYPVCADSPVQHVICEDCNRVFRNESCLKQHITNGTCSKIFACNQCWKTVTPDTTTSHEKECKKWVCPYCKVKVDREDREEHECFIVPTPTKYGPRSKFVTVVYDYETYLNDDMDHVAYCVTATVSCNLCFGEEDLSLPCTRCGPRDHTFFKESEDDDVSDRFVEWLFYSDTTMVKKGQTYCFAYNASGFDTHLVLGSLLKMNRTPKLMCNGHRILSLSLNNRHLKDLALFTKGSLRSLTQAFGLDIEKTIFPHKMVNVETLKYVGSYPDKKYFFTDRMNDKELAEFDEWHQAESMKPFNLRETAILYCQRDTHVLQLALKRFRDEVLALSGVCFMANSVTIANLASQVYRKKFLRESLVGLTPSQGYSAGRSRNSKQALKWLAWFEYKTGVKLQTAMSAGGEKSVRYGDSVYFLDGFYVDKDGQKVAIEYLGCMVHFCPDVKCRINRKQFSACPNPLKPSLTNEEVLNETYYKLHVVLPRCGYKVKYIWEHTVKRQLMMSKEMRTFFDDPDRFSVLQTGGIENPREALYGGLTIPFYSQYSITEDELNRGEKIQHMDVCSLYPWVQSKLPLPVGNPVVITSTELLRSTDLSDFFGIAKVRILCDRQTLHPVLPYRRATGSLVFAVCRSCADGELKVCTHSDDERAFTGVYTTPELDYAVNTQGAKVLNIYEVWHYRQRSTEIFADYIKACLTWKIQSSPVPDGVDVHDYLAKWKEREGIDLKPEDLHESPCRRLTAKTLLNSLWGKMGQNVQRSNVEFVNDEIDFYKKLNDPTISIKNLVVGREHVAVVSVNETEYSAPHSMNAPVVASFVTALGRVTLVKQLDRLGDRAIYSDTDSIIYHYKPGLPSIAEGWCLGDWTSELKQNESVVSFVSSGPKSYCYETSEGRKKIRFKGVQLAGEGRRILTLQAMRGLVDKEPVDPTVYNRVVDPTTRTRLLRRHDVESRYLHLPNSTIRRDACRGKLTSVDGTKRLRSFHNKRSFYNNYATHPFGYLNELNELIARCK